MCHIMVILLFEEIIQSCIFQPKSVRLNTLEGICMNLEEQIGISLNLQAQERTRKLVLFQCNIFLIHARRLLYINMPPMSS